MCSLQVSIIKRQFPSSNTRFKRVNRKRQSETSKCKSRESHSRNFRNAFESFHLTRRSSLGEGRRGKLRSARSRYKGQLTFSRSNDNRKNVVKNLAPEIYRLCTLFLPSRRARILCLLNQPGKRGGPKQQGKRITFA